MLVNATSVDVIPGILNTASDNRFVYNTVFDYNITSTANVILSFMPLLRFSQPTPRVINIVDPGAHLTLSTSATPPPSSKSIAYIGSKTAVNALTVEFANRHPKVRFYSANPGFHNNVTHTQQHCASVVVALAYMNEGGLDGYFWEVTGSGESSHLTKIPC